MNDSEALTAIRELLHEYSIDLPPNANANQIIGAVRYLGDAWAKAHAEVLRNRTAALKK